MSSTATQPTLIRRYARKTVKKKYVLLLIAFPLLTLVFLFNYVPLFGWVFSLFNYKPGIPLWNTPFVGLKYFVMALSDPIDMLRVMKNTVVFAALGYLCMPLPMILAILINEVKFTPFRKLVQTTTTLPNFIGWITIFSLSFSIFATDGLINDLLMRSGVTAKPINLLGDSKSVYLFQTILGLWKTLGWSAIIYLAGIAGIDQELYDAALVDGAGRLKSAIHITIPSLMPTFIVLMLLSVSSFVGVGFEQYFIYKNPLTADNIEVIDVYVYRIGLMKSNYSYGVAIGIMKSVIGLALLFAANGLAKRIRGNAII